MTGFSLRQSKNALSIKDTMSLSKDWITLYILMSAGFFFATMSNTIPAVLAYIGIVSPAYGFILLMRWLKAPRSPTVRQEKLQISQKSSTQFILKFIFHLLLWGLIVFSQFGVIATSAEDCYGWKMGQSCRSKLDVALKRERLPNGQAPPYGNLSADFLFLGMVTSHFGLLAMASKLTPRNSGHHNPSK